ncbi:MAG: hypothetical protein H7249_14570 [Chitinophagaceae bacterium]|nr:hypothetical protein [Oligoflexus sp.]
MKKLILALLVLCGVMTVNTEKAHANGAVVVFLQVRSEEYFLTSAIRDKMFNNSSLFEVLESSANTLMVARIDLSIYRWVAYCAANNYDVALGFGQYGKIIFHYYPTLKAFIGFDSNNDTVVLLPQVAHSRSTEDGDDTLPVAN